MTKRFCGDHKSEGMIDYSRNLCDCDKPARYNYRGNPAKFCKDCKKEGMIDVKNPRCEKCDKCATYCERGSLPQFCGIHRLEGMVQYRNRKKPEDKGWVDLWKALISAWAHSARSNYRRPSSNPRDSGAQKEYKQETKWIVIQSWRIYGTSRIKHTPQNPIRQ